MKRKGGRSADGNRMAPRGKRVRADNAVAVTISPRSRLMHLRSPGAELAWGSIKLIEESRSACKSRLARFEVRCGRNYYCLTVQPTKATLSTPGSAA